MKKLLIGLVLVAVMAAVALSMTPVRAFLVALTLPEYPDWPEPQATLSAGDSGAIYYPTASPYDLEVILNDMSLARPTTGLGYLSYPATASAEAPVPAMVIVPGSGGISPGREHEYAALFNQHGIAAFIVEYYAPRGFGEDANYLVRTSAVTEFDLIADAYAALKLLGSSPLIDPLRIGIIGFSYGGMASRLSMDPRIHRALAPQHPPFSAHIDNYGPCFQKLGSTGTTGAALLTLRGTADSSNDLQACALREQELRNLGVEVTAHIYDGAPHAWENSAARQLSEDSPYLAGCELSYDAGGKPYVDGKLLLEYAMDASHATKMAVRFGMSDRLRDCVRWGYEVGRDEVTRNRAYRDILAFLSARWGLGQGRPDSGLH
ncbi:MAG: dienelactone hydrolase family protein [Halioglobus sp.]|nr:dienelactone hydrolase family protein [Halioglobus sp.]